MHTSYNINAKLCFWQNYSDFIISYVGSWNLFSSLGIRVCCLVLPDCPHTLLNSHCPSEGGLLLFSGHRIPESPFTSIRAESEGRGVCVLGGGGDFFRSEQLPLKIPVHVPALELFRKCLRVYDYYELSFFLNLIEVRRIYCNKVVIMA